MPQQELVPVEEGPPKFALDNEEAIQVCTRFIKRYFEKSAGPQNKKFKNRQISNTFDW